LYIVRVCFTIAQLNIVVKALIPSKHTVPPSFSLGACDGF